jgi:hypothetical protein
MRSRRRIDLQTLDEWAMKSLRNQIEIYREVIAIKNEKCGIANAPFVPHCNCHLKKEGPTDPRK